MHMIRLHLNSGTEPPSSAKLTFLIWVSSRHKVYKAGSNTYEKPHHYGNDSGDPLSR
jgi:hypothetical protein